MPPTLRDALEKFGANRGRNPDFLDLQNILTSLSSLPPQHVDRAGREITIAAQLWPYQEVKSWIWKFRSQPQADLEILAKDANFAWLFLFHSSGFVREPALNAIQFSPNSPFFLSAIMLRLNDWVEPVRVAATQCARRVFPGINSKTAADTAQYFLRRYWTWERWQDEQRDALDDLFGRADVIAQLAHLLAEGVTGALATCLRHALRYPAIDQYLQILASSAKQPAVRATALQCLINQTASWPIGYQYQWIDKAYGVKKLLLVVQDRKISVEIAVEQLIRGGLGDRSAMVRRVAADALIFNRRTFPNVDAIVESLLRDKSPPVRERADFLVRHRND